jgi:hypothetical protein
MYNIRPPTAFKLVIDAHRQAVSFELENESCYQSADYATRFEGILGPDSSKQEPQYQTSRVNKEIVAGIY